jgi:hypothetical protein
VALALLLDAGCSSPNKESSRPASPATPDERAAAKPSNDELAPLATEESPTGNQKHHLPGGPFRVFLVIDKVDVAVGEPVVLRYSIQNVEKQEATIWISGFWPNHRVRVVHQAGQPATLTEFGKQCEAAFSPGGPRDKNVRQKLEAGDTYDRYAPIQLDRLFQLPAGTYQVRVEYHESAGPTPAQVLSNELTFRVGAGATIQQ